MHRALLLRFILQRVVAVVGGTPHHQKYCKTSVFFNENVVAEGRWWSHFGVLLKRRRDISCDGVAHMRHVGFSLRSSDA